ncbi:hypothetical protein BSR42_06870 [Megasphaera cerevisiae]|nr:hypothetical protein BSR42_06870 [Megasphaera cerevisiae]
MEERHHKMEKASLSIPKILEKNKLLLPYQLYQVKLDWKKIAGPQIAKYSYIQNFEKNDVIIAVLNSVWMSHLFMYKKKLIEDINAYLQRDFIHDIRFVRRGNLPVKAVYDTVRGNNDTEEVTVNIKNIVLPESSVHMIRKETSVLPDGIRDKMAQLRFMQEKRRIAYEEKGIKRCPHCGRWLHKDEKLCLICQLAERQKMKMRLYSILIQMPWLTLEDMETYGYIPEKSNVYTLLYNEVRRDCIYKYIERVHHGYDNPEDDLFLALFITRKNPSELTADFIYNLTEKYRRKEDVPSYRRKSNG